MKRLLLILVMVLVWAIILVSTMPLQFLVDKVVLPTDIKLSQVSGSVWSGSAHVKYQQNQLTIWPAVTAIYFAWRWCPSWESGLASICVEVNNPELIAEGLMFYRLWSKQLFINEMQISLPLDYFKLSVPMMGRSLQPQADLQLFVKTLSLPLGRPPDYAQLRGELQALQLGGLALGDYVFRSQLDGQQVEANYSGQGDDFQLTGTATANIATRQYQYKVGFLSHNIGVFDFIKGYATTQEGKKLIFSGDGVLPLGINK